MKRLVGSWLVALIGFALTAAGCQKHVGKAEETAEGLSSAGPTTRPVSAPGVSLSYPESWREVGSTDYALRLVPREAPDDSDVFVSLEIPKLPPHIPGLIPLGSVVSGYVDDMRKQHADVQVEPAAAMKLAGVNARRVFSTWPAATGKELSEDAVLTVRGDRVYIFRANADKPNRETARRGLDALLESVQWR